MLDRFIESRTLIYALAIILLSLMMMPIYWTVVTAFKPDVETYVFPPVYFPKYPTLVPLELLFEFYPFGDYLRNSLIVAGVTTLLVTFTGMLAAYGISQYPFRGGNLAIYALLVTRIIPPLSLLLPFYLLVSWLGLVDNLLSMIIASIYLTYPFAGLPRGEQVTCHRFFLAHPAALFFDLQNLPSPPAPGGPSPSLSSLNYRPGIHSLERSEARFDVLLNFSLALFNISNQFTLNQCPGFPRV